jgi:DNA-binding winged helix-turn-helix (wHTH) protein
MIGLCMKFFGDFEFDDVVMKLSRKGQRVKLTGQALGLLVLLLEHPGEVVTREEIQRKLWPDSSVEFEHSIDVVLNRLRKALGDNSKDPRHIQTVPRNGYRLIGEVRFEAGREAVVAHHGWFRKLGTYAAVALLAAAAAFLFVRARYDKIVRTHIHSPSPASQAK